jgi:hypothetical protein
MRNYKSFMSISKSIGDLSKWFCDACFGEDFWLLVIVEEVWRDCFGEVKFPGERVDLGTVFLVVKNGRRRVVHSSAEFDVGILDLSIGHHKSFFDRFVFK